MRIAICTEPGHIEVVERPVPPLASGKVLVEVSLCGICASDVAVWRGDGHKKYPCSLGHEFCGTIRGMDEAVSGLALDQRVVVNPNLGCGECMFCRQGKDNLCDFLKTRPVTSNGGFSEYVALHHRMVYPLPERIADEMAPFVEPLSCAIHAARMAGPEPVERAVVFGAGTMGILTGLAMRVSCRDMMFVEPIAERRGLVADIFDCVALSPQELSESGRIGTFDVAVECSGNVQAVAQAITALRKSGRLVLAGMVGNTEQSVLPLLDVTMKELEIRGAWLNPNRFEEAIRLAGEHIRALRRLRTRTFALDDIATAFEEASRRSVNKVIVKP